MSYDVAVIGAGLGGYTAAIRASQLGLKTVIFEGAPVFGSSHLGKDCVPADILLHSSQLYTRFAKQASMLGVAIEDRAFDFPFMMSRNTEAADGHTEAILKLFKNHNVEIIAEWATLQSANTIKAGNTLYEAKTIIIATSSEPIALPFLPFDEKRVLSVTGALALKKVPKSMLIVGGGISGIEIGSAFCRFGSNVTVIERMPQICTGIDRTLTSELLTILKKQKMKFKLNSQVSSTKDHGKKGIELIISDDSGKESVETGEVILVAIGRSPRSQDLGIASLNIDTTPRGTVIVDSNFRSTIPHIYVIGDLIDRPMIAHRALYEGRAVAEIIAGHKPMLSYHTIPNVLYTKPELATVGLSEEEAKGRKRPLKIGKSTFISNTRIDTTHANGLVKIIADAETDQVLGLHILANQASEMIELGVLALHKGCTLSELAELPLAYPTFSEAIREAALHALGRSYHT